MASKQSVIQEVRSLLGISEAESTDLVSAALDVQGVATNQHQENEYWSIAERDSIVELAVSAYFERQSKPHHGKEGVTAFHEENSGASQNEPSAKRPRSEGIAEIIALDDNSDNDSVFGSSDTPKAASQKATAMSKSSPASKQKPGSDGRQQRKLVQSTLFQFHSPPAGGSNACAVEELDTSRQQYASCTSSSASDKNRGNFRAQKQAEFSCSDQSPRDKSQKKARKDTQSPTTASASPSPPATALVHQAPFDGIPNDFVLADIDVLSPSFNAKQVAETYRGLLHPPFLHLCQALAVVCSTTKRRQKEMALTNILLTFLYHDRWRLHESSVERNNGADLMSSVLITILLAGNVASDGLVLNIGYASISTAICTVMSCSKQLFRQKAGDAGEMGDAAADLFSGESSGSADSSPGRLVKRQSKISWARRPRPLSIADVMKCLLDIHAMGKNNVGGGKGVEQRRQDAISKVLSAVRNKEEMRFAVKIFCSNIRTGATLITVMSCLAAAGVLHAKGMVNCLNNSLPLEQDNHSEKLGVSTLKDECSEAQETLRLVYSKHYDLRSVVSAFVDGGFDMVKERCQVTVATPLQPMLASPSRGVEDVVAHYLGFLHQKPFGDTQTIASSLEQQFRSPLQPFVTAEYKYDGQRVQIHFLRTRGLGGRSISKLTLFSRNLEDVTSKFTQVVEWLIQQDMLQHLESFILDTEVCAVKRPKVDDHDCVVSLLPFQILSTMKRKESNDGLLNAAQSFDDVGLCIFAFDLLFLNGVSLVGNVLHERRAQLRRSFGEILQPGYFEYAKSIDIVFEKDALPSAATKVEEFLMEAIGNGRCEGLMLKSLHSLYDGISREKGGGAGGWRKLKKDYIDSLADSIDVVPIGAWRGSGRKNKWFSPFLLAVFDETTNQWQSLCRCMSGFSDDFYETKYQQFVPLALDKKPNYISSNENPPFWFDPWKVSEVWEIRGADLTLSPVHHAGIGLTDSSFETDRGIALRFPRFVRVREDKTIEQASTSTDILSLFKSQSQRQ